MCDKHRRRRLTGYPLRDRLALGAALIGPLLVALALVPFRTNLSNTNAPLVLVVVVVAVAAAGGNRLGGGLAALSAAAWFDFFLAQPYQRFTIDDADGIETAVLLLIVGLMVSQLAGRVRRLKVVTVTDAAHLARLHGTADLAQSTASPDAVVDHVRGELTDLLQLCDCRFEYGTLLGHPPPAGVRWSQWPRVRRGQRGVLGGRGSWRGQVSVRGQESETAVAFSLTSGRSVR